MKVHTSVLLHKAHRLENRKHPCAIVSCSVSYCADTRMIDILTHRNFSAEKLGGQKFSTIAAVGNVIF